MTISKEITVGDKQVTVRELTMQQISDLSGRESDDPAAQIGELLSATTTLTREELAPFAPSELRSLVDAVLEVNSDFLAMSRDLGMKETADSLEQLIKSLFTLPFLA